MHRMHDSRSGDAIAETGLFGRSRDQDHTEKIERRKAVDHTADIAQKRFHQAGLSVSRGMDHPQAAYPFANRRPGVRFEQDEICNHNGKKYQAQRIGNKPAAGPAMIRWTHQPDALDYSGDRKKDRAEYQKIDHERPKPNHHPGISHISKPVRPSF